MYLGRLLRGERRSILSPTKQKSKPERTLYVDLDASWI